MYYIGEAWDKRLLTPTDSAACFECRLVVTCISFNSFEDFRFVDLVRFFFVLVPVEAATITEVALDLDDVSSSAVFPGTSRVAGLELPGFAFFFSSSAADVKMLLKKLISRWKKKGFLDLNSKTQLPFFERVCCKI